MSKFKYKIIEIDYSVCKIKVQYWTDGVTQYNRNLQSIRF